MRSIRDVSRAMYMVEKHFPMIDMDPIHFKWGVEIHLEKGSEVFFSADKEDSLPVAFTLYEGMRCYTYSARFCARECHDIAITGANVQTNFAENLCMENVTFKETEKCLETCRKRSAPGIFYSVLLAAVYRLR